VLNNQEDEKRVGAEIAQKIRQSAEKLNYRPNHIAKSLKTNKTYTIGLVVADITYRFTTGVTRSIEAEAKKNDYTVIFGSSDEDAKKFTDLTNVLTDHQVDGLILVPVENCEPQIKYLQKHDIPFVLIDRLLPGLNANVIAIDNYKAAYQCTAYLIKTGHNRIAFINLETTLFHLKERTRGYYQALQDNGLEKDTGLVKGVREKYLKEDMEKAVTELLLSSSGCNAVFFATDILAIQGMKHLNARQVKIPGKIAVLSFDESDAFDLFYCPVTHGRQPLEDIGRIAVNTLFDLINYNTTNRKIILDSDFVIGKSCGEG